MKKLFAILVVLALVAGSAFAQAGAYVIGSAVLAEGSSVEDSDINASGSLVTARIFVRGESGDGTFGGFARADLNGAWFSPDVFAFAWWQPNEFFRLQLGRNYNSDFGLDDIVGWGFYGEAGDVGVVSKIWSGGQNPDGFGFYGGFNGIAAISITPIDGLAINLGVPFENDGTVNDVYPYINAQVTYDIGGVGRVGVTFAGGPGYSVVNKDKPNQAVYFDPGKIYASFLLTAIEGMGLNVGLGYTLPLSKPKDSPVGYWWNKVGINEQDGIWVGTETAFEYNAPIEIGLGFSYDITDSFGIRARVGVGLGESFKLGDADAVEFPLNFFLDVLPFYNAGTFRIYLNIGMGYTDEFKIKDTKVADSVMSWHLNPYMSVGLPWVGEFYAGIKIADDGVKGADDKTVTTWSIPIGIAVSF